MKFDIHMLVREQLNLVLNIFSHHQRVWCNMLRVDGWDGNCI
jgi:hypothetical protein